MPAVADDCAALADVRGQFLRDIMKRNEDSQNFRVMGPDETNSNRLNVLFEATNRVFTAMILPTDDHISPDGRVMEILMRSSRLSGVSHQRQVMWESRLLSCHWR